MIARSSFIVASGLVTVYQTVGPIPAGFKARALVIQVDGGGTTETFISPVVALTDQANAATHAIGQQLIERSDTRVNGRTAFILTPTNASLFSVRIPLAIDATSGPFWILVGITNGAAGVDSNVLLSLEAFRKGADRIQPAFGEVQASSAFGAASPSTPP